MDGGPELRDRVQHLFGEDYDRMTVTILYAVYEALQLPRRHRARVGGVADAAPGADVA